MRPSAAAAGLLTIVGVTGALCSPLLGGPPAPAALTGKPALTAGTPGFSPVASSAAPPAPGPNPNDVRSAAASAAPAALPSARTTAAAHPSGPPDASAVAAPPAHPAPAPVPPPATSPAPTQPATRTVMGPAVDSGYGPVQVQVTITGHHLDSVQNIQLPNQDNESTRRSNYAGPRLARESVAAQSAKIDTVSGATYTSNAYRQSLQAALDQAWS